MQFASFEGIKGYKTYAIAVAKAATMLGNDATAARYVIVALPNGRFAPCVIANGNVQPGRYIPRCCIR